jgi:N6-L-threonylcarbamoyladenine synthase
MTTLCLGIETSCDETAAALVESSGNSAVPKVVLSDVVSTQIDIHRRFGGVVPEMASRNHSVQILPVIHEALHRANKKLTDVNVIAVTSGPGLQGALLVGLQVAKSLSLALNIPMVGVNHLEGHLLAIRLTKSFPQWPFLTLVVSGGHTTLYQVESPGKYERLGTTRDDAAGEAYDKVAKLLGLQYPGGQPIDTLAQTGNPNAIAFPRALKELDVLDWSFSGLKTSVANHIQKHGVPVGQALNDLCASFQEAVADALTKKAIRGVKKVGGKNIVLCGGVAANSRVRSLLVERGNAAGISVFLPPKNLCTDNGAMIAVAGLESFERGVRHDLSLDANPSWKLGENAMKEKVATHV